jgi:hypothetical protein
VDLSVKGGTEDEGMESGGADVETNLRITRKRKEELTLPLEQRQAHAMTLQRQRDEYLRD